MAIPSSQSTRSESEMAELRPIMPGDLFMAAIEGKSDVLIPRLGLEPGEPMETQVWTEEQDFAETSLNRLRQQMNALSYPMITTEATHSVPQQIKTEHQTVQSELQSATGFGDTFLHLLVTKWHNELALKVFQSDKSLLKARNKMLETPLHCAAKVGNDEVIQMLIRIDHAIVKNALEKTNENEDTVLHVAVRYDHLLMSIKLMMLYPKMAYKVNKEMLSPMYIAIDKKYNCITEKMFGVNFEYIDLDKEQNLIAMYMLKVDPTLACTQFTCGMFPVHLAACKGNWRLVKHLVENYPNYAELVDPHGRNLFHIAANEGNRFIFYTNSWRGDMEVRMNYATDYEGNTPLHIAAMKGHRHTMIAIWKNRMNHVAETIQNNQGLTAYEVSRRQLILEKSNEVSVLSPRISAYEMTYGEKFSMEWFNDVMKPISLENRWERTQVIGLGSVLITTVTFAAAFTIPGGYNQDNGTPILGRRYMFRAFILANTLAFIQGFLSLFALLINALPGFVDTFKLASVIFLFAASSMVVAFGSGLFVTLAPVCLPIAILVLVITLSIGSPALLLLLALPGEKYFRIVTNFYLDKRISLVAISAVFFSFIFCLALLGH